MEFPSRLGVHYRQAATQSRPPIVFVMGRGASGRVWHAHQIPAFHNWGWTTVTYDNRGVGANYVKNQPFSFQDYVTDLVDIIERHLDEPAFLVGTSLGSRIALSAASQRPNLVRGVVAAAAHARLTPTQIAQSQDLAQVTEVLREIAPDYLAAHTATMNLSPATLLNDTATADWLSLLSFSAANTPTDGLAQQLQADHGNDHSETYRRITVPVLALAYADDRVIFPAQVQQVARLVPGARYAELPEVGHFGYVEQPERFNQLVHEFFCGLA